MAQSNRVDESGVSWAALGLASVALAALFFTSGGAWPIPVLAVVLWCSPATSFRLPHAAFAAWIMRLIAFGFVGLTGVSKSALGADGLFDARTLNTLGLIGSVELVLQFWRESPRDRFQGSIFLWAGLVFLAASNTYASHIALATPLFALLLVLALRDFRAADVASPAVRRAPAHIQRSAMMWRGSLLCFALLLGLGLQSGVQLSRNELMSLGLEFLYNRPLPQVTGISTQPRLGSRFSASDSPQRVLRISGDLNDRHLRAASFDTYANGRWGPALTDRKTVPLEEKAVRGTPVRITRLVDSDNKALFAPLNSATVLPGPGSTIEYNVEQGGPLKAEEPAPYDYEVVESEENYEGVPIHQGPLCGPLDGEQWGRYLQLPPDIDPRVRDLANEITKDQGHPAERARAIAEYLMQNHRYSLEARRGSGDPVSNFLLDKRAAHCEYFASAAAVLLRCVGVPSRYVVGYYAHESDDDGLVVRQRDAHAWTECYIDGVGWVALDATPGDGRPESKPDVAWWRRAWERIQDGFATMRERMTQLSREQWAIILVVILVLWGVSRWRLARRRTPSLEENELYQMPDARLKVAAARFENWLQRENLDIPASTSWARYFAALPDEEFKGRELAQRFVREYEQARWSRSDENHIEHVLQLVEALETNAATQRKQS